MIRDTFKMLRLFMKVAPVFRDVSKTYKDETGKDRPAFLSQRVWGSITVALGSIATVFGVAYDAESVTNWKDHLWIVANSLWQIWEIVRVDGDIVYEIVQANYPSYIAVFLGIPLLIKGMRDAINRKKEVAK